MTTILEMYSSFQKRVHWRWEQILLWRYHEWWIYQVSFLPASDIQFCAVGVLDVDGDDEDLLPIGRTRPSRLEQRVTTMATKISRVYSESEVYQGVVQVHWICRCGWKSLAHNCLDAPVPPSPPPASLQYLPQRHLHPLQLHFLLLQSQGKPGCWHFW